jgi:D-tyrosyl-tRNA(Tyr) deacylase
VRAVVQRVHAARVEVSGRVVGAVERGLCAFVGAEAGDGDDDVAWIAAKIEKLRVFEDDAGKMSRAAADVGGGVLVVSQFTLLGDVSRGNRPSFTAAMEPRPARALVDAVAARLARSLPVATGEFGADMRVIVDNDGPVTILLDSRARGAPAGER